MPGRLRGRYFGQRTVFLSIAGTLASLAAAVTLDRVSPLGWTGAALSALTAVACLAGLASLGLLMRQHEPAGPREEGAGGWASLRAALAERRVRPDLHYQLAGNAAVGNSASVFADHRLTRRPGSRSTRCCPPASMLVPVCGTNNALAGVIE